MPPGVHVRSSVGVSDPGTGATVAPAAPGEAVASATSGDAFIRRRTSRERDEVDVRRDALSTPEARHPVAGLRRRASVRMRAVVETGKGSRVR